MLPILGFVGILVIVALLKRFDSAGLALRWRMGRVPESPIAEVRANQRFKVAGQVRTAGSLLEAPLTGARCVCYRLIISNEGSEDGGVVVDESESVPFLLLDSSGTLRIDPVLFAIVPGRGTTSAQRLSGSRTVPTLETHLQRAADRGHHQGALAMLRRGWPVRVEEHAIRDGSLVSVLGNASYRTDAEATSSTEIVLTCPDDAPLVIRAS